jgi:hypothetical protein
VADAPAPRWRRGWVEAVAQRLVEDAAQLARLQREARGDLVLRDDGGQQLGVVGGRRRLGQRAHRLQRRLLPLADGGEGLLEAQLPIGQQPLHLRVVHDVEAPAVGHGGLRAAPRQLAPVLRAQRVGQRALHRRGGEVQHRAEVAGARGVRHQRHRAPAFALERDRGHAVIVLGDHPPARRRAQ